MSIYITEALLLSQDLYGTDIDPNNPRIGWDNKLFDGSITADYEETDYPASNILNESLGSYWRSSDDSTTQNLSMQIDPATIDYCGIGGHNLAGATIQLQRRDDPGDPWTDVGSPFIPADNQAIMIYFTAVSSSSYWNIEIAPASGTAPRIASIYLGEMLTLSRKIWVGHKPSLFDKDTNFYTGDAGGIYQGRVKEAVRHNLEFSQKQVSQSFLRNVLKPWIDVSLDRPFYFAWRPLNYPNEVVLAWLDRDIKPVNLQSGNCEFDVKARALAPLL
jgi:hypothetical protein